MTRFTASPDDLDAVAALASGDGPALRLATTRVIAAGREAAGGVGPGHGILLAAVEQLAHVEGVVATTLADAASVLADGFAGAAEGYRDAEIHASALIAGGVVG